MLDLLLSFGAKILSYLVPWLTQQNQKKELNELAIAKFLLITETFSGACLIQVEDYIESIKSNGEFGNDYIVPPDLILEGVDSFLTIGEWQQLSSIASFYKIGLAESANIPYSENLQYSLWLRFKTCVTSGYDAWKLRELCQKDFSEVTVSSAVEEYSLRWEAAWDFYSRELKSQSL